MIRLTRMAARVAAVAPLALLIVLVETAPRINFH